VARTMDVSVIVSLRDRLTQPLRALTTRFQAFARGVGIVGATIAGLSFLGPIQQAAAFEQSLRDIAVTAGLTGDAVQQSIDEQRNRYLKLARDVGQSSRDMAGGAGLLQAAGMDPKQIEALLPTIGKVATAARAEVADISKTAFALSDSLRVPAEEMERAFALLATQGKMGRFELRDMAREFPELTSQMLKLGETGTGAAARLGAMLQVAMRGASNSQQAANNVKNFLSKITSPETIKNFAGMGVDIIGVMQDAATKGIPPIEAVLQKITKLTGISQKEIQKNLAKAKAQGLTDAQALEKVREQVTKAGGAAKLGGLFGDMQVLDALLPLMAFMDQYKEIRDAGYNAGIKIIDDDWKTQIQAPGKALEMLGEMAWQIGERLGRAFFPMILGAYNAANAVMDFMDAFDAANPGTLDWILAGVGGFAALAMALGAVSFILPVITAGLSLLITVLGAVLSPIGLIVVAIAAAGVHIARHWARFWPMFQRGADGLKDIVAGFGDWWAGFWSGDFARSAAGAGRIFSGLRQVASAALDIVANLAWDLLGWIDSLIGTDLQGWATRAGAALGAMWTGAIEGAAALPRQIYDMIDGAAETMREGFARWWAMPKFEITPELQASVDALVAWFAALPARLQSGVASAAETMRAGFANWWALPKFEITPELQASVVALKAWGESLIQAMIDGASTKASELLAWFAELPARIVAAIGSIDLTSLIKWPTMPAWLGGGGGAAAPSGAPAPSGDPAPGLSTDDTGGIGRQGSIAAPSSRQFAAVSPAQFAGPQSAPRPQPVDVGGTVTVKVIGPGQVTGTSSTNPNVPVTTAGGRGPTAAMA
jgi:TP901 family phage tail tape measure protein